MIQKIISKILELSQKYTDDTAQFLRDIIAIPSMSCQERDVVNRIKAEMQKLDYDEITIDPMGNILGRIVCLLL